MINIFKNSKVDYLSNTVPYKSRYPNRSDIEVFSMTLKKNFNTVKIYLIESTSQTFFYKKIFKTKF